MKNIWCCKFRLYHPVEAVLVVKVIEAYEQCKEISKRKVLFMEDIRVNCIFLLSFVFLKSYKSKKHNPSVRSCAIKYFY